jgi:DNA polymerase I
MESSGVLFDKEKLIDIWERIRTDIARLETEIYELIGERFNLNSPKQLQVILFEKLGIRPTKKNKTGYSVDNDVLEEIAKSYDIARLILEYRGLAKLSSTYVEWLMKSVDTDRRIHTTYDSLGAATGRMSSNDPNLQNIPTGDGYAREIKECFIPSEWNTLLVADYSQIELRILAYLAQDEALLEAFEHGEDIHARTAFFLFGDKVWWDKKTWKATSEQRRIAKSVNFGVIYGITWFWLAKTLDCSPWEAQEYVNAFYTKYPGVRTYYDTLLEDARANWYVETYFGRRRYIPGVNDANKTLRSISEREAMNMPVQGTAADIIKIAMVELDRCIHDMHLGWRMILQVHDELVFDIPLSEKEVFEKLVRETMEDVLVNYELRMSDGRWWKKIPPITVDISTGYNWSEAK